MKNGPKVVVIGAGSYFFGKPAIWNMVKSPILQRGTLALVDTNAQTLATMMRLAHRAAEAAKSPVKIIGSTDRREVLKDADFVVLTFSFRNAHYRGVDTRIARKYGVTMCSADTIGPGGVFRALREIPEILRVAADVRALAPDAWLINFINPTSVNGIALMRYAPEVRSFALCDGNHEPYVRLNFLKMAGILRPEATTVPPEIEKDVDLAVGGVNHFTWIVRCTYKGQDMMGNIRAQAAGEAEREFETAPSPKAKPRFNANYGLQLLDVYGAYPTARSHTKEYVPFFQGYGVTPVEPEPILPFNAFQRADEMKAAWAETEKLADGRTPIEEFLKMPHGDHATDIVESMWGGLGKPFYINTPNRGAVTNMPSDAFLELRCDLDLNGPRPQPFGPMPRGLLALQMLVLDTHELTAEAAVTCDRRTLLRALATDPIINNLGDARNIMNELLEAEREHLPAAWWPATAK